MYCPECKAKMLCVRTARYATVVIRVRLCPKCLTSFRTFEERVDESEPSTSKARCRPPGRVVSAV